MKQRNPFVVLLLSIITLGIYDIYWLAKTKTVLNKETKIHTPTIWLLLLPYLIIAALFLFVVGAGVFGNTTTQPGMPGTASTSFTVFVLLSELVAFLLIVPITFIWFFKYSKAINEYTNGELNTGVTFLLLWLLHFIGVCIVQDKFNDMLLAGRDSVPLQPEAAAYAVPPAPVNPQPQAWQAEDPAPDTQGTQNMSPALPPAPVEPTVPIRSSPSTPPTDRHHKHHTHPDSRSNN